VAASSGSSLCLAMLLFLLLWMACSFSLVWYRPRVLYRFAGGNFQTAYLCLVGLLLIFHIESKL